MFETDLFSSLFFQQVKELNHVLEAEKSCRTDLEMYVAVLNTQKSVLQEDAEKLRKELHEGDWGPFHSLYNKCHAVCRPASRHGDYKLRSRINSILVSF